MGIRGSGNKAPSSKNPTNNASLPRGEIGATKGRLLSLKMAKASSTGSPAFSQRQSSSRPRGNVGDDSDEEFLKLILEDGYMNLAWEKLFAMRYGSSSSRYFRTRSVDARSDYRGI